MSSYYVYDLYKDREVVYVGSTTDINSRVSSHKSDKDFDTVKYCETPNKIVMLDLERYGIYKLKPMYNKRVTQFTNKPDGTFDWKFLNINGPTQEELDQKLIELSTAYMEMQAEMLGVDLLWMYNMVVSCTGLFQSYELLINERGDKTVAAYTDDRGKSLDKLCESLGVVPFNEFVNNSNSQLKSTS